MSPEQARGRAVDRRADIWAFGVVLFEMLPGRRAFEGDDVSTTIANVLKDDRDWSALPVDTPPRVRRVLRRCLEKDPRRRLSAIGDARLDLDEPDVAPDATATTAPARARTGWLPIAGALAAGMLIAAIGVSPWMRSRARGLDPPNGDHCAAHRRSLSPTAASPRLPRRHDGRLHHRQSDRADGHAAVRLRRLDAAAAKPHRDRCKIAILVAGQQADRILRQRKAQHRLRRRRADRRPLRRHRWPRRHVVAARDHRVRALERGRADARPDRRRRRVARAGARRGA